MASFSRGKSTLRAFSRIFPAGKLVFCCLALAGCGREDAPGSPAARDDFGNEVVPGAARRIISLNPATTEMLFAIGAGSRVIGRTTWDSYPESARLVPDMGPGLRPNLEVVIGAKPDLVVLYASADNRPAAERLRSLGIATLAVKNDSIGDLARTLRLLGIATGDSARAVAVADSVRATLERVRAATAGRERRSAFWYIWDSPLITIGRGSYMSELLDIAGARNLYDDITSPSPTVTLEDVVRRNPDVVIAGPDGTKDLRGDARWSALPAVKAGRIIVADTALVAKPSVRLGEAAVSLARALHPGIEL
ncbi:MAG: ABC transporter substrate-binding protein [Gemmatimonadaceae bacterium]